MVLGVLTDVELVVLDVLGDVELVGLDVEVCLAAWTLWVLYVAGLAGGLAVAGLAGGLTAWTLGVL